MTKEEVDAMLAELDEPFPETPPLPLSTPPLDHWAIVSTPKGEEIVEKSWTDEPTRVMTKEEIDALLSIHTRPTLRSMEAVMPPSSRPPPESQVTVVGEAREPAPMVVGQTAEGGGNA